MQEYIAIAWHFPEIHPEMGFSNACSILSKQVMFTSDIVVAASAQGRDASLAEYLPGPLSIEGPWPLEIAVELPDLIPNVDGKSESILEVTDNNPLSKKLLCISNRISKCHYVVNNESHYTLRPRDIPRHRSFRAYNQTDNTELEAIEEQLRTCAAMRFEISGKSAVEAFESNIEICLDSLLSACNKLLSGLRQTKIHLKPNTRIIRRSSIPIALAIIGDNDRQHGIQIMLSANRAIKSGGKLDEMDSRLIREHMVNPNLPSVEQSILGEAESSLMAGDLEFAFLQMCIAVELATTRAIHSELQNRQISQKAISDQKHNMNYSWMLNIGIRALLPDHLQPGDDLISSLNSARKARNLYMHDAKFHYSGGQLRELLSNTRTFVELLLKTSA